MRIYNGGFGVRVHFLGASRSFAPAILAIFAFASSALAGPPARVLREIQDSYHPQIQVRETTAEQSPGECASINLEIDGRDPVSGDLRTVKARSYLPKAPANTEEEPRTATILILPPTGGENELDRGYADLFCTNGFRAIIVQSWAGDGPAPVELESHDPATLRALTAVRHVIEYVQPKNRRELGIIGASLGAIIGNFILGYEPRVGAGALIVGGVGLPEIIARSTETHLTRLREARMRQFRWQRVDEYQRALGATMRIEPADFVGFTGRKPTLTVVATQDSTVPTINQLRLVQALGNSERIEWPGNHLGAIISTYQLHRQRVLEFFRANLN